MGVNFSPFEIGRRALRANQLGMSVTGQNIANVNTPGYSRQSVQLSATPTDGSFRSLTGTGVTIDGVRSFRDRFVESRLHAETGIAGRLTAQRNTLSPVEAAFDEAGGAGINSAMTSFFGAFRELEAHPESDTLRSVVVDKASVMASAFATTRGRLTDIRREADNAVRATADEVNTLSAKVANLNAQIGAAEGSGANASELRDQRSEAVRQLADLTGARAVENPDGMVTITLGDGRALVLGDHASNLEVVDTPPDGLASLKLDGLPAVISDGRLSGLLDSISTITAQINTLDQFSASLATRVNSLHNSGTDMDGNAGTNFFATPAGGGPITAANLTVSAALKANPRLVVASPLAPPQPQGGAATIAGAIANLLSDSSSQVGTRTGSFSSIYASLVGDAGHGVRSAEDALATHGVILAQVTAQRDAISGVSLDEEAINLLQYQKAYEAAARFLQIADEMTQTILALGQ